MADEDISEMFGYAEVSLDTKTWRFAIPINLFTKLGSDKLRMTLDPLGQFLELRSEKKFAELADRIIKATTNLPPETAAALITDYLGFSCEVQVDNVLRVVVPKMMRDCLEGDTELSLIAVGDAVRIWSRRKYKASEEARRDLLKRDYGKYIGVLLGLDVKPREPEA